MLPLCSATSSCSTHSQISLQVVRSISSSWRVADVRCSAVDSIVPDFLNSHLQGVFLQKQPIKVLHSKFLDHSELSDSIDIMNRCSFQKDLEKKQLDLLLSNGSYPINQSLTIGTGDLQFVQNSDVSAGEEKMMHFSNQLLDVADILPNSSYPDSTVPMDDIPDDPSLISETLNVDTNSLSTNAADIVNNTNKSIGDLINKWENIFNSSVDSVVSSIKSTVEEANKTLDNITSGLTLSIDRAGESAGNKLSGFSDDMKEASGKVGIVTVDLLRKIVVVTEDTLVKGVSSVAYSYDAVKGLLPPEIQDALNASETKLNESLRPLGSVFQRAYGALQELEGNFGLDPNDPIVPFILFLGAAATLWGSYWILTYGGYAGDLSPRSTLDILRGKENVSLIDIRPEDLRERDGVPDLRRAARFRFTDISVPEVDNNLRKLLKGGRDLDDMLIAAVIRNLKIVKGRSKVIILDVDGSRSKGVARSLKKLGIKDSYLVKGGFRSWVQDGLQIKELRPETALTILNEEAEAIIEDIKPTPQKLIGFGVGLVAAAYAIIEWEKTLQLAGLIGIGLTIFWRVSSYEDSEDLKQDVRLLLTPVRYGGQAISWAAGKLETNRNGLPTIPSSTDVRSRVLQAAAKHESQPSDSEEETKDLAPELTPAPNENMDLSEA